MEYLLIALVIAVAIGGGFFFWKRQKSARSSIPLVSPASREHEEVYEVPSIRMTEEGDLTDSFMVQMKELKKYRDQVMEDENQE